MYQFCSKACCEDYKKLHCIVTFCEYCQEEKTLHETVKFLGVKRPFCSEGHYSVLNFCRSLTVHCPVIKSTAVHIMTCCDFIFRV